MNIGTDTPSETQLQGVPHHLIDVVNPDEPYDTARFCTDCDAVIADIHRRGKRVILAGGTGLYIRVLLRGLQAGPPPDPNLRKELMEKANNLGWPHMHTILEKKDPETANRLHPNDGVRILRALEVEIQSGIPISKWHRDHAFAENRYPAYIIGIERPKEELNQRINQRVDKMMEAGFLKEVKLLVKMGYGQADKPLGGLGYKRMLEHLEGQLSIEDAVEKTKTDTRRFSKRQRTWFNKEKNLHWMVGESDKITQVAIDFYRTAGP